MIKTGRVELELQGTLEELTDGTLNSETILATAVVASTVAKFARLQDEENKEAGQEDD